ncbi:alpha-galactosidase [Candidatus Poribacteria bacterium]|nr:alpha-galactosidase [Candidatus Poribacteria bacterium]
MKIEDLSVSRRGKLVVIDHQKYQIEYNLTKGTWNYNDQSGKTIIKNGLTQVGLSDGTTLKTSDAGYREFTTEGVETDSYGTYQLLRFSYQPELNTSQSTDQEDGESQDSENSDKSDPDTESNVENINEESNNTDIRINTYLTCYSDLPYVLLKIGVENLNTSPVKLKDISLIDISTQNGLIQLGGHPSQYHLYLKLPPISPNSATHKKIYDGFNLTKDNSSQPCQDGLLYDTETKKSLLFGFLSANKWWPGIQVGYQASKRKSQQGITTWGLYNDFETAECDPGNEITTEIGYIDFVEEATTSYKKYTERLGKDNNALALNVIDSDTPNNLVDNKTISGWSITSEKKDGKLSAEYIGEHTRSIADNPLFKPIHSGGIDYIHLDSGWQKIPGEIDLNSDDFPDGMASVVEEIHKLGFKASICIDPYVIDCTSKLVSKFPDICLRSTEHNNSHKENNDKKSKPTNEPIEVYLPGRKKALAILDVSHPETQKHVKKCIKKVCDDWGFDLIKTDMSSYTSGMMSINQNVSWYDRTLTSTELYRMAVNKVKEYIASTQNTPIFSGYNIIESVSIGNMSIVFPLLRHKYVHNTDSWHQQNGIKNKLSRYTGYLSQQNLLWGHAYGDLYVDSPRPANEVIVELTTAALSGGAVYCVNDPTSFSQHRAELLAKILPISKNTAYSADRFDKQLPQILHLPVATAQESWDLIGIFNWNDHQEDILLDLADTTIDVGKDFLVHDFWIRQYLGIVSKKVSLMNIPPRSAKLLCLREQLDVPQLLSTDLHYSQGAVEILSAGWDENSQSYMLVCKPPRESEGTFFIHVPEEFIPTGVSSYGSKYRYKWEKPIYELTFDPTDSLIHTSIQFTKTTGGYEKT